MALLLRILLALHLCGLALMAGTTVIDYFTFRTFCNLAQAADRRAQGLLVLMERYGDFVRTGAVTIILTGITMLMIKTELWDQLWFKIKLGLAVLVVLNGIFVGNNLGTKFRKMAFGNLPLDRHAIELSANLHRFYIAQLIIFILIIFVSMIRPVRQ